MLTRLILAIQFPKFFRILQKRWAVIIIIMKNFNRHSFHGHHGSKRRDLAQHTHWCGSHAFLNSFGPITALITASESAPLEEADNCSYPCAHKSAAQRTDSSLGSMHVTFLIRPGVWAHTVAFMCCVYRTQLYRSAIPRLESILTYQGVSLHTREQPYTLAETSILTH